MRDKRKCALCDDNGVLNIYNEDGGFLDHTDCPWCLKDELESLQAKLDAGENARRIQALEQALQELVRLKDLKDRNTVTNLATNDVLWENAAAHADYSQNKAKAWDAARAALKTENREG